MMPGPPSTGLSAQFLLSRRLIRVAHASLTIIAVSGSHNNASSQVFAMRRPPRQGSPWPQRKVYLSLSVRASPRKKGGKMLQPGGGRGLAHGLEVGRAGGLEQASHVGVEVLHSQAQELGH